MTKSKKRRKKRLKSGVENNPVAKHAHKFNKAAVHRDKKNEYRRWNGTDE